MILLDRVTAAQPDEQRELIEEGAYLLRPVWLAVATDWNDPGCEQFTAMLNAGAYLDAVLLMMPEGAILQSSFFPTSSTVLLFWDDEDDNPTRATAATPALAVLAARLKAVRHDD